MVIFVENHVMHHIRGEKAKNLCLIGYLWYIMNESISCIAKRNR